jgi:hypothetical protein
MRCLFCFSIADTVRNRSDSRLVPPESGPLSMLRRLSDSNIASFWRASQESVQDGSERSESTGGLLSPASAAAIAAAAAGRRGSRASTSNEVKKRPAPEKRRKKDKHGTEGDRDGTVP